jgi:pimeloyl-ACP methyl ester carboxylesterase
MATFVLIHGAGDVGWYWHLVEVELRLRGHDTVAPDLPCDDDSAGLPEYVDAVVQAIGDRIDLVVVAQSLGGFTAPIALFYQDVPPELASEALKRGREQSEARIGEPSPLKAWPDVTTTVLLCRDDRLFPPGYVRRVAQERLGITPDEIDGGHTPALSRPKELADRLLAYGSSS